MPQYVFRVTGTHHANTPEEKTLFDIPLVCAFPQGEPTESELQEVVQMIISKPITVQGIVIGRVPDDGYLHTVVCHAVSVEETKRVAARMDRASAKRSTATGHQR